MRSSVPILPTMASPLLMPMPIPRRARPAWRRAVFQVRNRRLYFQRGLHGVPGMIGLLQGRTEQCHEAVAEVLVQRAAMSKDHPYHAVEILVQGGHDLSGGWRSAKVVKPRMSANSTLTSRREVRRERDALSLSTCLHDRLAQVAAEGVAQDFPLRNIGQRVPARPARGLGCRKIPVPLMVPWPTRPSGSTRRCLRSVMLPCRCTSSAKAVIGSPCRPAKTSSTVRPTIFVGAAAASGVPWPG